MIYYIYDASGNVIGLKYNDDIYYYEKNIQNDITGIMDDSFNLLAKYEYDSWGNILSIKDTNGNTITDSTNIALVNPFRYRSYYYDSEIGMYYLNSRYYNQEWGRFINADGAIGANGKLLGNNLYAYVNNNPIMFSDPSGNILVPSLSKYMTRQQKQQYFIKTNPIPPKSVASGPAPTWGVSTPAPAKVTPMITNPMRDWKESPISGASPFTYPGHQENARDFQASAGTPIRSSMWGEVKTVVMKYPNDFVSPNGQMSAYGNYIDIIVWDGTIIRYAHQNQSNFVNEGDLVIPGQQIGIVGNTGFSRGFHLHFETFGGYVENYLP